MPTFACTLYTSCENASSVTNKDIVNPIEARSPNPKRFLIFIPSGKGAIFSFVHNHVKPTTPTTFPTNKPKATPTATLVLSSSSTLIFNTETPALAKAKMGMITKVTKGCIACSSFCNGGMALLVSVLTFSRMCS